MKKINLLFRKRPSLATVLLAVVGATCLVLLPLFFTSCEEEEADCGAYVEHKTGRNKVYKSDLQLHQAPGGGLSAFYYDEESNVGRVVFTYVNDTKRCSKNPDGYDFRSVVDIWVEADNAEYQDLIVEGNIEMFYLGRKDLTAVATGAGPNTIHAQCTNGWMDFSERDESSEIMTRISIGVIDASDEEGFIDYLIDSLKLEIQYSEFYYRI